MTKVKKLEAVKSELLLQVPGLWHDFGTRKQPISAEIQDLWTAQAPRWKQVHGIQCAEVRAPRQECGEVDALFSLAAPGQAGHLIAVVTADCVPILLARREGGAVAAVHAGWRGTRARILRALWGVLASAGEKPSEWVAAIGPSIGPCCYEVSEELARDFATEFGDAATSASRRLNLQAINRDELLSLGLTEVDLLPGCTRCAGGAENPLFHSYRREGGGHRQFSMILSRHFRSV